ncbi:MAG: hypothetical protein JWO90_1401, partial [Solirubrobacterales bacterium]|nr:hypothetical protein [Solirubrobacterales bacterium]
RAPLALLALLEGAGRGAGATAADHRR